MPTSDAHEATWHSPSWVAEYGGPRVDRGAVWGGCLALHIAFYNFSRIHVSLRVTPAMEAGTTDHVWNIGELVSDL